jgi:hypothetical protein
MLRHSLSATSSVARSTQADQVDQLAPLFAGIAENRGPCDARARIDQPEGRRQESFGAFGLTRAFWLRSESVYSSMPLAVSEVDTRRRRAVGGRSWSGRGPSVADQSRDLQASTARPELTVVTARARALRAPPSRGKPASGSSLCMLSMMLGPSLVSTAWKTTVLASGAQRPTTWSRATLPR